MKLLPKESTWKTPAERFTGDVWLDPVSGPREPTQRAVVANVRFAPGSRTAWHSHVNGQTLHVTDGIALFGSRDGTVLRVHAGQTVYAEPGEEHWHGASPTDFMQHLAVTENGEDPAATTTWLEHVSDADYQRAAQA